MRSTLIGLSVLVGLLCGCTQQLGFDEFQHCDPPGSTCPDGLVACEKDTDCPSSTCAVGRCADRRCVADPAEKGTPGGTIVDGDCLRNECDGTGKLVLVEDAADVLNDLEDCTLDECSAGQPKHTARANGVSCKVGSANGQCAEGHCVVECSAELSCPDDDNPCTTDACDIGEGTCDYVPLDGVPTPGVVEQLDCMVDKCVAGSPQSVIDDTELPEDNNDCTDDTCTQGAPANEPLDVNAPCGAGGAQFCDGAGSCGECNTGFADIQCSFNTPCETPTCIGHVCGVQFVPNGDTNAPAQKTGDCHLEQCNGAGVQVSVVDDTDTPNDGNDCTANVCTAGVPSNPLLPANAVCAGVGACNALGLCKNALGAVCATGNDCGSGNCVDGVCCSAGSCPTCQSCDLNSAGSCANLGSGVDDIGSCAGASSCDGNGACKSDLGVACAANGECLSGSCVDGVCCNAGSCPTCQACNLNGAGSCADVGSGVDDVGSCAGTSSCDGNGACKSDLGASCGAGSACLSGNCLDGVCCSTGSCATCLSCNLNGLGTCSTVPSGQDDVGSCSGTQSCDGAGVCKSDQGAACAANSTCISNACADGFCCNASCGGTCQACSNAKTGSPNGTCANVTTATDPDNECATVACYTGSCNGSGACGFGAAGTPCGSSQSCSGATQINQDTCNGAGTCVDQGVTNCAPYSWCGPTSCGNWCYGDLDCVSGYYCTPYQTCAPKCIQLDTGHNHTCVLRGDGTVWCWGSNGAGQLGDGTTVDKPTPQPVPGLSAVVEIAAGGVHTVARKSDGTVWCWGINCGGPSLTQVVSLGTSSVAISAGGWHSCALKGDGTLWCWGDNTQGQLGDGQTYASTLVPVQALTSVASVTGGYLHTCARKTDGTLWCWGHNSYGQLGDGTTTNHPSPSQVSSLGSSLALMGSGAGRHTCAGKNDNSLWCWGYNAYGQLGNGNSNNSSLPVQVWSTGILGSSMDVGPYHTCARKSDSTIWCWGRGLEGQIGIGNTNNYSTPQKVTALSTWATHVSVGDRFSCALDSCQCVYSCWGSNMNGQFGDGSTTSSTTPVSFLCP